MTSLPMHVVPEPDEPEFALPFVDAMIDGRPYRLLLDTGAALSWVAADEHTSTLVVVGQRESNGAFSATVTDDLVKVGRLTVGPIEKTDLTVVRCTDPDRPGLVGMDALGDMTLVVDFGRSEVRFAPGGALPTDWPLRRSPRGHPFLDLRFGEVVAETCWDTGASVTVVSTGFFAANSELFTPIGASVGTDSTGAVQETPTYLMASAEVGGITLAPHTVAVAPLPQSPARMDIVLGYPALKQFTWTMDFPQNRWTATPNRQTE